MKKYITKSEEETKEVGRSFAQTLRAGDIVALSGDLGSGKTAFVKGVTEFFGGGDVTSPTFALVNQYDGDVTIYHFDVYRLENSSIDECDWMDDYLFGDGICLIEWADNISAVLPGQAVWVSFEKIPEKGENYREISIGERGL